MLLTLTTTLSPATDLGFLLHKNPARPQRFDLSFGSALVFYPVATPTLCTAALLLDVDPVALVRRPDNSFALDQYVNDRPYVASSLMSVAIAEIFGTALSGICKSRPELASTPIPLVAEIAVLPCHGNADFVRDLFAPLGYAVETTPLGLDPRFPDWGTGPYVRLKLTGSVRLVDLLSHLYVLIPVLDNEKHYFIDQAEVDKLLRHGEGWLHSHPLRDAIVDRYLRYRGNLARRANEVLDALSRLEQETTPPLEGASDDDKPDPRGVAEDKLEQTLSLNDQRHLAVCQALLDSGATSVVDLGCAQGRLLRRLMDEKQFTRLVGLDVSVRSLETAARRLRFDRLSGPSRERIDLWHGSLTYRDARLKGFDAACLVEVIEHLDPPRLAALERVVFAEARPATVIVTTPNIEYNVRFETLAAGKLRHGDHRFEWTRKQFADWASRIGEAFGYIPEFTAIGPVDEEVGSPTQMFVFSRKDS